MQAELFQQKILAWFAIKGRKDLPWQQHITPYRIWLSEIMLQQTQVTTVIPYFNQFITDYPDVYLLANASEDAILQRWSGLGYYARARNLHKTAQLISQQGGVFPNNLTALMNLPGIGRSTAGAILSIAFKQRQPILDGNVKRVLARFHAVSGWSGYSKVSHRLWQISTRYTPLFNVEKYTQAMMDLGATVCTRSKPKCSECPVNNDCLARIENKVAELPTPKPKKKQPIKHLFFLLLHNQQKQFYLQKRPAMGIWGGLWSFPEFNSLTDIKDWCLEQNISVDTVQPLNQQRHTFSHYHLDYTPVLIATEKSVYQVMEGDQVIWYKIGQADKVGLPAPVTRLLQTVFQEESNGKNS